MVAPLLAAGLIVLGVAAVIAAGAAVAKLIEAGKDADQNFSSCPVGSSTQTCPLENKALTPEQAQQWFDHFKNDRPDIPFKYPTDCCYTRAWEMADEMNTSGIPVGKVWNYATGYPGTATLHVPTQNDPSGAVNWIYHVAPIVPVRLPDGSVQEMVIDPSMEEGPVTVDKWKADQHDSSSKLVRTQGVSPYVRSEDGKSRDPHPGEPQQQLMKHEVNRQRRWAGLPPVR